MSVHFGELAKKVGADGVISSEEVLALRQGAWPDGRISQSEAEAIFALNNQLTSRSVEWVDFFVEALGEYVLNQRAPKGYVDSENAQWLMAQIDADGVLGSMAELELLVRVFERAQNVPVSLKEYALRQVEKAVLEGVGPTRCGGELEAGNVNATEVKLLRRAIFAPASERPAAVGPNEAAMLFRIKDATLGADNADEWKQLFVQGVANYLQGYSSPNAQISSVRAMELQTFVQDSKSDVGRFLGRVAKSAPNVMGVVFGRKQEGPSRADEVDAAHQVTAEEQRWLETRITSDGEVDELEQALLDFLVEE